jgi:uncharacterized protein (DUF1800 family)
MAQETVDLSPRESALTLGDAYHLVRRATFHPNHLLASSFVGKGAEGAVAELMALDPPIQLPTWANDPPALTQETGPPLWSQLQNWWIGHCAQAPSMREVIVAMWHNHFTSDYITVYASQWMVKQSILLRNERYNFRALGEKIVGDPAMLRYLNGNQSVKGNPNENFAREWFELFSLGVGNYTEADIVDAARAFTGWRITGANAEYSRQLADLGPKTILGETGNWEYPDVIRITLEQEACRRFIAAKVIRTFVEHYPSDAAIDAVADLIQAQNFDLRPVIKTLLSSKYFFDESRRGALIKSPMQLVLGLAATVGQTNVEPAFHVQAMTQLTQAPFYPPTVEGWKGHHAWISSTTFPNRQRYGESFIDGRVAGAATKITDRTGQPISVDLVSVVRALPDHTDAEAVVSRVCELLLPVTTSQEQRDILLDVMMAGLPASYWNIDESTAGSRLRLLFQTIVRMPEFQLT